MGGRLLPWKFVGYWQCIQCGECCRKFKVPLNNTEKSSFLLRYPYALKLEGKQIYLRKKIDGSCAFQFMGKCMIQEEKPLACKIFPFYIETSPLKTYLKGEALYTYRNKDYYVYVHSACKGIGIGYPIEIVIPEVIEIVRGNLKTQILTTFSPRAMNLEIIRRNVEVSSSNLYRKIRSPLEEKNLTTQINKIILNEALGSLKQRHLHLFHSSLTYVTLKHVAHTK